jgi:hypothetical protein
LDANLEFVLRFTYVGMAAVAVMVAVAVGIFLLVRRHSTRKE